MNKQAFFILAAFLASGCAEHHSDYQTYLTRKGVEPPTIEHFQHCHAYGCQAISDVTLGKKEWLAIENAFRPRPKNAQQERERIARAIGIFETTVGAMTGTAEDMNGTFEEMGHFQQDCVDESTNTTIYLSLLKQKNLLKFHDPQPPTVRLPFTTGRWPHQTAVIADTKTGELFAVDSWFHNNGAAAEIVPLAQWKDGWEPNKR